jgi:hypothetical protein
MEMRLPILPRLVELTMDSTYYDCAGRPGAKKLMASSVHENLGAETLDFGSRDNPTFVHERNELELCPECRVLNTEYLRGLSVKPDAHATGAYRAGRAETASAVGAGREPNRERKGSGQRTPRKTCRPLYPLSICCGITLKSTVCVDTD